jgi:hypothetical protein
MVSALPIKGITPDDLSEAFTFHTGGILDPQLGDSLCTDMGACYNAMIAAAEKTERAYLFIGDI